MTDRTAMERRCRVGWMLACSLWLTDARAWQIDQLFQSQCTQLEEQLLANQERQRQGFRLRDEAAIERAETALEQLIDDACQTPKPDDINAPAQQRFDQLTRQHKSAPLSKSRQRGPTAPQTSARSRRSNPTTPAISSKPLPGLQISTLVLKAPYSGEKLMAWLGFYREPARCFGVRDLHQIVRCADARHQARQQFERWWQQQQTTPRPPCRHTTAQRHCEREPRNLSDQ